MRTYLLGLVSLFLAFLISVHHLLVAGRWFDLRDVLHHEFFIALAGGVGLGILFGARFSDS
jgi:hypothetical protein